jgi:hypothetical protein
MSQEAISSIQAMLAPAVLMTTAAITAGGIQTMYSAVNDRMREMTSEKLTRFTGVDGGLLDRRELSATAALRVGQIDAQLPLLRQRHRSLRNALQLLYSAIVLVVVTMILIAVAITVPDRIAGTAALVSILAATAVLLAGIGFVGVSVMRSISAVDFEVDRTLELGSAVSPPVDRSR